MFIDRPQPQVRRTELITHTCDSCFGLCTPRELVFKAKEYGITALAVCDFYSTNAYPQFYAECKRAQIKAIYGAEISIDGEMVAILAKNPDGIIAINKLLSNSNPKEFSRSYETKYEELEPYKKDLITVATIKKDSKIEELLIRYDYIGIASMQSVPYEILKRHEFKFVLVSKSFYIEKNDKIALDILLGTQANFNHPLRAPRFDNDKYSKKISYETANMISDQIEEDCYTPPTAYDYPDVISAEAFEKLVYEKTHEMFGKDLPIKIRNRLEKELPIISNNKYLSVFYISYLVAKYAKENNVVTQMRGKCAASLVCYILGISSINPMDWDLPLEMFYGSDADINLPDIDFSVDALHIDQIIKYLKTELKDATLIGAGTIHRYNNTQIAAATYRYFSKFPNPFYEDITNAKLFKLRNTFSNNGAHPGGILIVPKGFDIYKYTFLKKYNNLDLLYTGNDYLNVLPNLYRLDLLGNLNCTMIRVLCESNKIKREDIPLDDKDTLSLLKDDSSLKKITKINPEPNRLLGIPEFSIKFSLDVIDKTKPSNIEDLVKVNGILHGSGLWYNNLEDQITKGSKLENFLTTRDDIHNYLVTVSDATPEFAYETTELIRKGRGVSPSMKSMLKSLKVPDDLIDFLGKVKYVTPKTQNIGYALTQYTLMYFKIKYPSDFYIAYIAIYLSPNQQANQKILVMNSKELLEVLSDQKYTYIEKELAKILIEAKERGLDFDPAKLAFVENKKTK